MRLAVITNDYPPRPGGIQQYLGNLVAAHDGPVLVLGPADRGAVDAPAVGADVVISRGPTRFMWPTPQVRAWASAQLDDFRPDAILFGAPHPLPLMGPRLRTDLGVPFGVIGHGAEVTLPSAVPGLRTLLRRTLVAADVRFGVSHYTAGKIASLTGAEVTYLGAGVDTTAFHRGQRRPTGAPLTIGCVSRFVPRKGQRRLLDAAARLRSAGADIDVLLVGRGRDEGSLRTRADRLGVPTRFVVDAPWTALPALYGEMDLFCMPCRSRWGGLEVEGLGLVFLEAAAVGLPVLAGDSGGAAETVVPGETGYVVSSVTDIVEALEMLLDDAPQRQQLGAAGSARIAADFTWDRVAARLRRAFGAVSATPDSNPPG